MRKLAILIPCLLLLLVTTSWRHNPIPQENNTPVKQESVNRFNGENLTNDIPTLNPIRSITGFQTVPNVAQYGGADWSNVVGIAHSVTLDEAAKIAMDNPEITYFFHMKGYRMVLGSNVENGSYRIFHLNDAVFFSGEPWWGSAVDFADGFIKE